MAECLHPGREGTVLTSEIRPLVPGCQADKQLSLKTLSARVRTAPPSGCAGPSSSQGAAGEGSLLRVSFVCSLNAKSLCYVRPSKLEIKHNRFLIDSTFSSQNNTEQKSVLRENISGLPGGLCVHPSVCLSCRPTPHPIPPAPGRLREKARTSTDSAMFFPYLASLANEESSLRAKRSSPRGAAAGQRVTPPGSQLPRCCGSDRAAKFQGGQLRGSDKQLFLCRWQYARHEGMRRPHSAQPWHSAWGPLHHEGRSPTSQPPTDEKGPDSEEAPAAPTRTPEVRTAALQ